LLYTGDVNRPKTINSIVSIDKRNQYIVECIGNVLQEKGRKLIVLSDRIEHFRYIKENVRF
jgi:hypothetical protein